jgi:hypothetical protein
MNKLTAAFVIVGILVLGTSSAFAQAPHHHHHRHHHHHKHHPKH